MLARQTRSRDNDTSTLTWAFTEASAHLLKVPPPTLEIALGIKCPTRVWGGLMQITALWDTWT